MTLDDLDFLPQGTPGLNIQAFDCGRKSVNDFFHNEAQDYQDELFGKTYYFCLPDSPSDIVAGFTVANASIFTKRLPNARQKKIGREVHHEKGLINYPSILLAQLGVDIKYKGQRNGLNLFFSSLEQEMQYRNWDVEKDGPLETRLMFRDMILLKRPSIR